MRKIRDRLARSAIAASYNRASASESAVTMIRSACGNVKKISEITIPMGP